MAVQAIDGIVQPPLGIDTGAGRQRVVDVNGPALFFESSQEQLLIFGGEAELFHEDVAEPEDAPVSVPARVSGGGPRRWCGRPVRRAKDPIQRKRMRVGASGRG